MEYYGYGGDFGDVPNDGHFVMDGLLWSDHTPAPGLLEYKKAIQPVQVLNGTKDTVTIINRYDHVTLDHLRCSWTMVCDGNKQIGQDIKIPKGWWMFLAGKNVLTNSQGVRPGNTAALNIVGIPELSSQETYLELSFTLIKSTNWAEAGHEVAFDQIALVPAATFAHLKTMASPKAPELHQLTPQLLQITSSGGTWRFNIVHGLFESWSTSGDELLASSGPVLGFYRAQTDNDSPSEFGRSWTRSYLQQTKQHVRSVSWIRSSENATIVVNARIAPPVLEWNVETVFTYTFTDKYVSIKVAGTPKGPNCPDTFSRIGLLFALSGVESATWFGRGPGESYRDKKLSQRIGNWTLSIDELFTDYEYPQEGSNRTDVRWVQFMGKRGGMRAYFADLQGASFQASHYTTQDVEEARHPFELKKKRKEETLVRLDWAHHGLGTGSCGPATLPEYELKSSQFEFEILLEAVA